MVVPAAFLDILVFPSSVLQRGEVRENANSPAGPNFVPKNLRNKRRFKQSGQRPHFPKSRRSVVFPWFLENSTRNMSLLGTKHRAKKRRRRTKFCSQQRPIGGKIRSGKTTINHNIISIGILGAALFDPGGIGQLWLSWHHISSAAHFVRVFTWLIVMNRIFSCCTCPMKLKLSHMKHIGIGQPRTCLLFGLQMRSGQERGSPW